MTGTRMTALERGEQVLEAAVGAFAESGYAATKTGEIARRAGVSQPYVIRLFGSKLQLFLAVIQRVCDRIEQIYMEGVDSAPEAADVEAKLEAMRTACRVFAAERDLPRVLIHAFSASADPIIGTAVRERYGRMYELIRELTSASVLESRNFMATGMLLAVMTAMRVVEPDAEPAGWATEIMIDIERGLSAQRALQEGD